MGVEETIKGRDKILNASLVINPVTSRRIVPKEETRVIMFILKLSMTKMVLKMLAHQW